MNRYKKIAEFFVQSKKPGCLEKVVPISDERGTCVVSETTWKKNWGRQNLSRWKTKDDAA